MVPALRGKPSEQSNNPPLGGLKACFLGSNYRSTFIGL